MTLQLVQPPKLRPFLLLVCGIMNDPENHDEWEFRAEEWFEDNFDGCSTTYAYKTGAWRLAQEKWSNNVGKILGKRNAVGKYLPVDAAGHSNGAELLASSIRGGARCRRVSFIGGAMSPDFNANGLNRAIAEGRVREVLCFCSPKDEALPAGRWFGYGDMGIVGPKNLSEQAKQVTRVVWKECGHNDWVTRDFDATMQAVSAEVMPGVQV